VPDTIGTRAVRGQGRWNHEGVAPGANIGSSRNFGFQRKPMFGNLNIATRPMFDKPDIALVVDQKLICYDVPNKARSTQHGHAVTIGYV
jgi:hypothetical protein